MHRLVKKRNQAERSGKLSLIYTGLHVEKVSIYFRQGAEK